MGEKSLRYFYRFVFASGVLAVTAGAAGAECNPVAVDFNTKPAPVYRSSAMRDHFKLLDVGPKKAPLMLIGDSQGAQWPQEKLDALFGKGNVLNLALAGDRIQNTLWRLEQIEPAQYNPSFIFLALGTNNQGDEEPGCAIAKGLTAVQVKLANYWPNAKIIMLKMMPRGTDGFGYQEKERVVAMKEVRLLPQTTLLDVDQDITCGLMGVPSSTWFKLKSAVWPGQSACKYMRADSLHLSNEGYDYIGARLKALAPVN